MSCANSSAIYVPNLATKTVGIEGKINKIGTATYCKTISYDAKCPGLDSFRYGLQYLVSSVCQICVVNLNVKKNWAFNIHFFTLLFVFKAKVYFSNGYWILKSRLTKDNHNLTLSHFVSKRWSIIYYNFPIDLHMASSSLYLLLITSQVVLIRIVVLSVKL
jgi:hypothetical protein